MTARTDNLADLGGVSTVLKYCNEYSNDAPNRRDQVASDAAPHAQTTPDDGIGLSLQAGG